VTSVAVRRGRPQGRPRKGQGSGLRPKHRWNIGQRWYVDALNGSDATGNGSAGSPWQSLQKAADYLRTTATWPVGRDVAVNIRPTAAYKAPSTKQATLWTDFTSAARAPAANRYLIWRKDPAYSNRPVIRNPDGTSSSKGAIEVGSNALNSYQIFSGLNVDGEQIGKGTGAGGSIGIYLSGTTANSNTHIEVLDTKIHGFRIGVSGGTNHSQNMFVEEGASFLLLDQVESYDNGGNGNGPANSEHGLYVQSSDVQITNSVFRDNPNGYGAQFYNGGAATTPRLVIANSTFNNNYASGILVHGDEDNVRFENLIITGHYRRGNSSWGVEFFPAPTGGASGSVIDHVLYYHNYANHWPAPAGWTISNEKSADPRFVNAAAGDLHLLAGSPALGFADGVFSPAVDFDGVPRRADAEDAGAFERQ
jgi:hypothetical protein